MSDKLSKTKRLLFVIAVMFSNIAIMGDSPLYTISNELYNAWPNSSTLVSFALSAPPLIMILAAFLAIFFVEHKDLVKGWIAKITKKEAEAQSEEAPVEDAPAEDAASEDPKEDNE